MHTDTAHGTTLPRDERVVVILRDTAVFLQRYARKDCNHRRRFTTSTPGTGGTAEMPAAVAHSRARLFRSFCAHELGGAPRIAHEPRRPRAGVAPSMVMRLDRGRPNTPGADMSAQRILPQRHTNADHYVSSRYQHARHALPTANDRPPDVAAVSVDGRLGLGCVHFIRRGSLFARVGCQLRSVPCSAESRSRAREGPYQRYQLLPACQPCAAVSRAASCRSIAAADGRSPVAAAGEAHGSVTDTVGRVLSCAAAASSGTHGHNSQGRRARDVGLIGNSRSRKVSSGLPQVAVAQRRLFFR